MVDADRDSAKISLVPAVPSLSSITSAPNLFSSSSSSFFSSSSSSSSSSWCRSFYLANCIRSLKPSLRTDAQSLGLKEAGEAKIEEEERGAGGMADGSLRGYRVVEKYPGGVLICARIL